MVAFRCDGGLGNPELEVGIRSEGVSGTTPSASQVGLTLLGARPLASSPRCVKRGLWLAMYTLVRLGVSVRKVTYSGGAEEGGRPQPPASPPREQTPGVQRGLQHRKLQRHGAASGSGEPPVTAGKQGQAGGPAWGRGPGEGAGPDSGFCAQPRACQREADSSPPLTLQALTSQLTRPLLQRDQGQRFSRYNIPPDDTPGAGEERPTGSGGRPSVCISCASQPPRPLRRTHRRPCGRHIPNP